MNPTYRGLAHPNGLNNKQLLHQSLQSGNRYLVSEELGLDLDIGKARERENAVLKLEEIEVTGAKLLFKVTKTWKDMEDYGSDTLYWLKPEYAGDYAAKLEALASMSEICRDEFFAFVQVLQSSPGWFYKVYIGWDA